jgi:exosortase
MASTSEVEIAPAAGAAGALLSRRGAVAAFWTLLLLAVAVYAPILRYMVDQWSWDDDYSHGFLIVPLAAWFAWERRAKLRRAAVAGSWWGLAPLFLGTLTLGIGRLGVELMNMRVSFVLTAIGLVLLLLGRQVFRILLFPLLFLFLMVPLPKSLVNVVAFPLQLLATDMAVHVLHWLAIPSLREGNIIHLATTDLFVADACSGLRSLTALITLGVTFAYFFRKSFLERAILVAATIPIAILVNMLRVAATGVLAHELGPEAAKGWIHELQGLVTFGLSFVLLLVLAGALRLLWPRGARASGPRGGR